MIELRNVTKFYRPGGKYKLVLDDVTGVLDTKRSYGLLGANGAGKSTLLRLLAGSEIPNRGRIRRRGRISWPLGFSGGFHPSMTGRENVAFIARIYNEDIERVTDFAEGFAQIGQHINAPVSTYSTGTVARLAFAVSMAVEFDFYLIDEIVGVGDAKFAERCQEAFAERAGRSGLILASHHQSTILEYCQHGLVLKDGQLTYFDEAAEAIDYYRSAVIA